jgi:hypothetical protein
LGVADPDLQQALALVRGREPSVLNHHGAACCDVVAGWAFAYDRSHSGPADRSPPTWPRVRWEWGANAWPLHWCDLERLSAFDCGGFSALTRALLHARGIEAWPVQLVQRYPAGDSAHWSSRWQRIGRVADWVAGALTYHEALAIDDGAASVRVWDPTENRWLQPERPEAYGGIVAMRFVAPGIAEQRVRWGSITISSGAWVGFADG